MWGRSHSTRFWYSKSLCFFHSVQLMCNKTFARLLDFSVRNSKFVLQKDKQTFHNKYICFSFFDGIEFPHFVSFFFFIDKNGAWHFMFLVFVTDFAMTCYFIQHDSFLLSRNFVSLHSFFLLRNWHFHSFKMCEWLFVAYISISCCLSLSLFNI